MAADADNGFTTIRVIDVKKATVDLATSPLEEIATVLAALRDSDQRSLARAPLEGFLEVATRARGRLHAFQSPALSPELAIQARELLANPAYRPVVGPGGLRVRVAQRTQAAFPQGRAFATEDALAGASSLTGVVRVPDPTLIIEEYQKKPPPARGAPALRKAGAYAVPVLAAVEDAAARPREPARPPAEIPRMLARERFLIEFTLSTRSALVRLDYEPADSFAALLAPPPPPPPPPPIPAALEYFLGRVAQTSAATISRAPDARLYELSPIYDLYRAGALNMYQYLLAHGRDSELIDDFLAQMSSNTARVKRLNEIKLLALKAANLERQYRQIVEELGLKKHGAKPHTKTHGAKPHSAKSHAQIPAAVAKGLTPQELDLVQTVYENRQREMEANSSNPCPHLRLVKRLQRATTAVEAADILKELASSYYKKEENAKTPRFRMCRSCNRGIICPHAEAAIRLNARRAPFGVIQSAMMEFAQLRKRDSADVVSYYCGICGERMAEAADEAGAAPRSARPDGAADPLRTLVWSELAASADHMRFPVPTDPRQYASKAVDTVYPLVVAAEASLSRRGARRPAAASNIDEFTVEPRLHLYIALFAYAYGLATIQPTLALKPADQIGFEGVRPGARLEAYGAQMLQQIMVSRRAVISRITDITEEFIAARFAEAFRMVRGLGTVSTAPVRAEEILAEQITQLMPVYQYAAAAARAFGSIPTDAPVRVVFETVMGSSLPALVKRLRETANRGEKKVRRAGIEIPAGADLEFLMKEPRANMLSHLYLPPAKATGGDAGHHRRAAQLVSRHQQQKRQPFPTVRSEVDELQRRCYRAAYILTVKYCQISSETLREEYGRQLVRAREEEEKLLDLKYIARLRPRGDFGLKSTRQFFPVPVKLGSLYDESGQAHRWDVYCFRAGAETLLVPAKDVSQYRADGRLTASHEIVDVQCSVCSARKLDVGSLDETKVARSLEVATAIDIFYAFFEVRCPMQNLHNYDAEGRCTKCGLRAALVYERQSSTAVRLGPESRAYYDKFEAKFREERDVISANTAVSANTAEVSPAAADVAARPPEPDYAVLISAAELADVPVSVIEALGAMEGREYADVVEGRQMPPPPTSLGDPRILSVDSLIRTFIIKTQGKPTFPDPLPRYREVLAAIGSDAARHLEFQIEYLCRLAIAVNDKAEWAALLKIDRLVAKPGAFNFAVFTEDPDEGVDLGSDVTTGEEDVVGESEDNNYTQYNLNEVDYDGSNE